MAANPNDATFQRGTNGQRRPPRVKFYVRARFDQRLTERAGRSSYVDENVVDITSPDGSVTITKLVDEWFAEIDRDYANYGQWVPAFRQMYRDWQESHDPKHTKGVHISNWPLLSASQVENLLALNIRSIEEVADMPDAIATEIDGGTYIRSKARYWINSANDVGAIATEAASLRADKETLTAACAYKDQQIEELQKEVKRLTDYFTGKEGFEIVSGRAQPVGLHSVQAAGPHAGAMRPATVALPLEQRATPVAPPKLSYDEASALPMSDLRTYAYERNIKPGADHEQTLQALLEAGEIVKNDGAAMDTSSKNDGADAGSSAAKKGRGNR